LLVRLHRRFDFVSGGGRQGLLARSECLTKDCGLSKEPVYDQLIVLTFEVLRDVPIRVPEPTETVPPVGASWPSRIRNSVVLPQPFGPISPSFSPALISNETPLRTF
jgi:hypothetical protein